MDFENVANLVMEALLAFAFLLDFGYSIVTGRTPRIWNEIADFFRDSLQNFRDRENANELERLAGITLEEWIQLVRDHRVLILPEQEENHDSRKSH